MPNLNAFFQRAGLRGAHRSGSILSVVRIFNGLSVGEGPKKWLAKLGWRGRLAQ